MAWLSIHTQLAYVVLFFGCFFETLVGPAFFLPGEIFLISGSVLAGARILNIGFVALVCYSGGILGDSTSYFLGKLIGPVLKNGTRILSQANYQKGEDFFKKYGLKAIFLARLLGPLSWVTPFLAGTYQIPYKSFVAYNIPGVLVGISEFLIVGYFFGNQYERILTLLQRYFIVIALIVILLVVIGKWYSKRRKNH